MMPASSPQHGIEYPETTRCQAWRTFRCCQLRMHRTGSARYVRCRDGVLDVSTKPSINRGG
jgi:hypothetical protein